MFPKVPKIKIQDTFTKTAKESSKNNNLNNGIVKPGGKRPPLTTARQDGDFGLSFPDNKVSSPTSTLVLDANEFDTKRSRAAKESNFP